MSPETNTPIFHSEVMKAVQRTVERIAPGDEPVLITGEPGTGKELIADLIHALSTRHQGPLVKINFLALPPDLIESELFGCVNGSHPGIPGARDGLFQEAAGGSLFMDEVCSLPPETQGKLVQVLEGKSYHPGGGRTSLPANCRVIASTTVRPEAALGEGKLRPDLHRLISRVAILLPPLRERREDIVPLATAFLVRYASQARKTVTGFTPEALEFLSKSDWPGNVRQLENTVREAVSRCRAGLVDVADMLITSSPRNQTNLN